MRHGQGPAAWALRISAAGSWHGAMRCVAQRAALRKRFLAMNHLEMIPGNRPSPVSQASASRGLRRWGSLVQSCCCPLVGKGRQHESRGLLQLPWPAGVDVGGRATCSRQHWDPSHTLTQNLSAPPAWGPAREMQGGEPGWRTQALGVPQKPCPRNIFLG